MISRTGGSTRSRPISTPAPSLPPAPSAISISVSPTRTGARRTQSWLPGSPKCPSAPRWKRPSRRVEPGSANKRKAPVSRGLFSFSASGLVGYRRQDLAFTGAEADPVALAFGIARERHGIAVVKEAARLAALQRHRLLAAPADFQHGAARILRRARN